MTTETFSTTDLDRLHHQLAAWRRRQSGRARLPEAGVERPRQVAAHLFRHTLASRMLLRGAHLREISQVPRHRALVSTEIYAKIDLGALQEVVRPWPTEGGAR